MPYGLPRWIVIVVAALLGSAGPLFALPILFEQQPKGLVKGKIIGVHQQSGIPDARIIIRSAKLTREVIADQNGAYQIELPADVYTITTEVPEYHPYRRAPFRVRPGTTAIINVLLSYRLHDTGYGDTPKLYYEELTPPHSADQQIGLLVQYERRNEGSDSIEYDGATLYYDTLTVSAISIVLDKRAFGFKAKGNVHVDNGQESGVYVKQADVSFVQGTFNLEFTLGAVDHISGKGSIDGDRIDFEFKIEKDHAGQFTYDDMKAGIGFSTEVYSFRVLDDAGGVVEIVGRAKIKPRGSKEDLKLVKDYNVPVQFVATVQDGGDLGPDTFSISIDLDSILKRSGKLSKGDIEVHRKY